MIDLSTARGRVIRRALVSLASLVVGAGVVAAQSDDFRDFVGSSPVGSVLLVVVPPLLLALDKYLRERKSEV